MDTATNTSKFTNPKKLKKTNTMYKKISLLLLSVVLSLAGMAQNQKLIDEVIAIVGNKAVLLSSIEAQYIQQQAQGYRAQSKCQIFEGMLFQKLLLAQAELDSIVVSDAEVSNNLEMRLQDYIRQAGGREALERYFGKTIAEIKAEFEDVIRDQMISQRMQGEITKNVAITPQEVNAFYATIPQDSLPMVEAELEVQQIMKRPPVNPAEKEAARQKLDKLRERVIAGESFATLAILYSQDPGSARNGGELGFVNRADLDQAFAEAAFNLRDGQVSRVIESEFGLHIIQLIERRGEDQINVRHILITPKVTAEDKLKAKQQLDSIAAQIAAGKITFDEAARLYSDDKDSRNNGGLMVNPYTGTARFETKHLDAETNRILQRMKIGDLSEAFEAKDQRGRPIYRLVKLKNKTQPHVANIKDDYQQINELALQYRQQEAINSWMKARVKGTFVKINTKWSECKFQMPEWIQ